MRIAEEGRVRRWLLPAVCGVLLLAAGLSLWGFHAVTHALVSLDAAERFAGNSGIRFAQLACFLPVDEGKTEEDIFAFRQALEGKLVEQSLETPENGSLWLDAYSCSTSVTIASDRDSAQVEAIAVGGDFFYFHPLHLRSGSYISSADLMDDLVLLDEEMAWRLFGGTELTGLPVTVNGAPFIVGGVISREDDFATRRAWKEESGIYLSYSALARLDETASVSCYEIVMPDPISGYAESVLSEQFPMGGGEAVENSSRYSAGNLLAVLKSFGERSMRTNAVIYPYWENAVRLTEDYAALLLVLAVLFALCPAVTALVLGVGGIRRSWRWLKTALPAKWEAAVEKHREHKLAVELEKLEEE